MEVTEMAKFKK